MKSIQQALGPARLQPDAGGVYMYGEAWDFGEVRLKSDFSTVHELTLNGSNAVTIPLQASSSSRAAWCFLSLHCVQ